MAQTTPPSMTPAPSPAPQRNDRATFSGRVDAFVTWLAAAISEFSALATNVYNNAVDAYNSATSAATQAGNALTQANNAAASANAAATTASAAAWINGGTYALNASAISQIDFKTYRKKTVSSVTTIDPASDSVNWVSLSGEIPGLKLLATITPTVAANVDFLNAFSGSYDSYLIVGTSICNSSGTTDILSIRFANSGTVDLGANYATGSASTTTFTGASNSIQVTTNVLGAGKGANFAILIKNCNSSANLKSVSINSEYQVNATPGWRFESNAGVYVGGAVSGLRFFWSLGGSNFLAQGGIKIFGIQN